MNAIHSCMATIVAPVLVAGALAFVPVEANAQAVTGEDTATTKVTIVAGSDWGQKTEVVVVQQSNPNNDQTPSGFLATTGDAAPWATLAFAGVAAAGLMAWAIKHEDDESGREIADGKDA